MQQRAVAAQFPGARDTTEKSASNKVGPCGVYFESVLPHPSFFAKPRCYTKNLRFSFSLSLGSFSFIFWVSFSSFSSLSTMSPPSDSSYCRRSRLHLFLILPALFTLARSQCYNANGTVATDPDYAPCSNSTSDPLHTICCSLNRDNPPGGDPSVAGFTRDECLANGICQNKWSQNGGHTTSYFREKCTEKDWSTGLCLDVCTDSVCSTTCLLPTRQVRW